MPLFPIRPNRPWLAPLAGFSDLSFRLLCREFGASVTCTEMVSAKGLIYKSKGTSQLLATVLEDSPLVVQIFGSEPDVISQAMDILVDQGVRYFDLNSGCPVKKVVKTGSGAALLKTPNLLIDLVELMARKAGPGKVGIKIRLGWQKTNPLFRTLAPELENAGAAWITLHPRFAKQGFSGVADWACLKEIKQRVAIPIIASGDLFHAEDAVRCIHQTEVDAVMFARGALNDPAIFRRFIDRMQGRTPQKKDKAQLLTMIKRLMELSCQHGDEAKALLRMRTLAPRFVRDLPGSRTLRNHLVQCRTWENFSQTIEQMGS